MTNHRVSRLKKMAVVMAGLSVAVLSIGATEPTKRIITGAVAVPPELKDEDDY